LEEEPTEIKASRLPNLDKVINYKDFFGEYPIIFTIKIISSLALIYVISEFYIYHNPMDSLLTKYLGSSLNGFDPNPEVFVPWGFAAGFMYYFFTIFKGKYKFLLFLLIVGSLGHYIVDPAINVKQGEYLIPTNVEIDSGEANATQWKWKPVKLVYDDVEETNKRIEDISVRLTNVIFGSMPFLGAYGIWKRKGWAIGASIGLAIIIGFLYTPNLCLENFDESYCGYDTKQDEKSWSEYLSSGIFIGLGFVIYIELSYAAIKYENYAEQFKPAGLDISLLTNAQRKSVSKTLRTLFVSYLINLAVILFITFIIAEVVININNYLSASDGQIQDSIELQGPYGIVFTSLIFFLLLGIIRMFIGPDNQMEET
tara:strand:- start:581 stop:1690 length:1110 start_codon:yes stop_codon:yes gene_type:complete